MPPPPNKTVLFIHGVGEHDSHFSVDWASALRLDPEKWNVHFLLWEDIVESVHKSRTVVGDTLGDLVLYLLCEANVRDKIRNRAYQVAQQFDRNRPVYIVGHSWGSVIAYELLHSGQWPGITVDLLLTIGSPLWMEQVVTASMGWPTMVRPQHVHRWVNVHNLLDGVAGHVECLGVENFRRLWFFQRHDAATYLRTSVARELFRG